MVLIWFLQLYRTGTVQVPHALAGTCIVILTENGKWEMTDWKGVWKMSWSVHFWLIWDGGKSALISSHSQCHITSKCHKNTVFQQWMQRIGTVLLYRLDHFCPYRVLHCFYTHRCHHSAVINCYSFSRYSHHSQPTMNYWLRITYKASRVLLLLLFEYYY